MLELQTECADSEQPGGTWKCSSLKDMRNRKVLGAGMEEEERKDAAGQECYSLRQCLSISLLLNITPFCKALSVGDA